LRRAVNEERRREAGHVLELGELFGAEPRLAAGDDIALAGVADRRRQQLRKRQPPAVRAGGFERQHPAGDRARNGERGERTARRDGFVIAIKLGPRIGAGAPRRHQRAHPARRLAQEPEAVAADMVHVRIDGGDRGRHGDHRLDRVAAVGKDRAPRLGGGVMRRADDALAMSGSVKVHRGPCHSGRAR
jgi:hypothetical protein